jgi:hypothetical protein
MKRNLETIGLSLEISGLVLVLLAALWQAGVTDWLDRFPANSQYYIQETANLAVLQAINRTALAQSAADEVQKKELLDQAADIANKAGSELIQIRKQVEDVEKRQSAPLKIVRICLFVLGALLIIFGKGFVLLHKSRPD